MLALSVHASLPNSAAWPGESSAAKDGSKSNSLGQPVKGYLCFVALMCAALNKRERERGERLNITNLPVATQQSSVAWTCASSACAVRFEKVKVNFLAEKTVVDDDNDAQNLCWIKSFLVCVGLRRPLWIVYFLWRWTSYLVVCVCLHSKWPFRFWLNRGFNLTEL